MKAKKFRFQQTVTMLVKTRFDYKIKANTAEEAESILMKILEEKTGKGKAHLPLKKLNPKKSQLEVIPAPPSISEQGSVIVEFAGDSKNGLEPKIIYTNLESAPVPEQ